MFEAQQEFIHTVFSLVVGDLTMEVVRRENDDVTINLSHMQATRV